MNRVDLDSRALVEARRIVIIGSSGSGKSTLAKRIAEARAIPHVSMDRAFFWLPGWKLRDRAEIRALMRNAVAEDAWVMDGNSARTLDVRLARAQLVLWLRLPRLLCLYRVVARFWRFRGQVRPEMADGCPEKIDREFLSYVWNFERAETPQIEAAIAAHGPDVPLIVLRTRSQLQALLERLRPPV